MNFSMLYVGGGYCPMKITLNAILLTSACKNYNLLSLKSKLIECRKKGIVFYRVDLYALEAGEEFDLYYYITPSSTSFINAFPIPISRFRFDRSKEKVFQMMRDSYFEYYKQELTLELYDEYKRNKPFKGSEYIWYHRPVIETFA